VTFGSVIFRRKEVRFRLTSSEKKGLRMLLVFLMLGTLFLFR
jgi:hypothetical protein